VFHFNEWGYAECNQACAVIVNVVAPIFTPLFNKVNIPTCVRSIILIDVAINVCECIFSVFVCVIKLSVPILSGIMLFVFI
jgi:hypothetical protein